MFNFDLNETLVTLCVGSPPKSWLKSCGVKRVLCVRGIGLLLFSNLHVPLLIFPIVSTQIKARSCLLNKWPIYINIYIEIYIYISFLCLFVRGLRL